MKLAMNKTDQAASVENEEFTSRLCLEDTKEATKTFFEKRPPDFTRSA